MDAGQYVAGLSVNYGLSLFLRLNYIVLWPVMVFSGIVTNLTNVIIFIKMGLKDSVTISFLALSVTDLCYLLTMSVHATCIIIVTEFDSSHMIVDPFSVAFIIGWYGGLFYDLHTFITVFIAIARCCCVAIPIRFRGVFTTARTVGAIAVLCVIAISIRMPLFITYQLDWVTFLPYNVTKLAYNIRGDNTVAQAINDIGLRNVIPWSAFFIVLVCLVVLIIKLRAASKFRAEPIESARREAKTGAVPGEDFKGKLSNAEARSIQVIKSVTFVSALFIIMGTPFMIYSFLRRVRNDLFRDPKYIDFLSALITISYGSGYLNASITAFIYYNCNTKYREILLSFWKCKDGGETFNA